MQPVPRIFISATSRDLRTARALVSEGLRRMECLPIVQDDFPPDYKSVRDMLRTKIKDCNAVVHLAGFYYGAEPQPVFPGPDRRSFTQMEYEIAMELNLPCYVFLCGKDFPFDQHDPEPEEKQGLQMAHRDRLLKRDELFYEFASPEELANRTRELQLSVEGLRGELAKERGRRRMAMIAAVAALLIAVVGGIWMHGRQEKTEAVNVAQTTEIAALKAQLEGPTYIVGKVNAAMMLVREQGKGTEEEMKATAIKMVAQELKKPEEEVKGSIETATKVAQQLIAAAQTEGKNDPTKLSASRKLEADTLQKLADAHLAAGRVNEAVKALQQRLELLDRDKNPEAWVQTSEALAARLRERNSFEEGRQVTSDAFEWAKTSKAFGPEHPTTLRLMLDLASRIVAGSTSKDLAGFVLKIRKRDLGPDHADTLEAVNILAQKTQSAEEAGELFRSVIDSQTKALGAEHKETLKTKRIWASQLRARKDYAGAGKLLVEVLATQERTLGLEHADTANTMVLLASLKQDQKDYTGSIALNRRALAIYERIEGPDGANTLITLNNLALALDYSNDPGSLDEAIVRYDRVLETKIRTIGAGQAATLLSFWNLALALEEKGDDERAKALLLRRLDEQEKAFGQKDTAFLNNLSATIEHFSENKDHATALSLAKRRLKIREATQPEGAIDTLDALKDVANLEDDLDNTTEAVRLTRLVIALVESKQPQLKTFLAQNYNNLSYFLGRLGEKAEALTQMRKCVEIAQVAFKANDTTRGKYETRLTKMEGEAKAPTGTTATAAKNDKVASSADRYADFRKTVDDKIESEKWRLVTVPLTASKPGRKSYLTGRFEGEELRRVMHVDSTDDDNETLTFYYWSEGLLTSVNKIRTGSDVPIKGVNIMIDTHNFLKEKLMSWTQSGGGKEEVMDPNDPDFSENGQRVIALGNEAKALLLQADKKTPGKAAAPTPLAVTASKTKTPSLEEYAAFQKELDDEAKSAGWKQVMQDLPGNGGGRRVYLNGWFEGKQLRKLMSVDKVGEAGGTYKFYYWTDNGIFTSAFCRREGTGVLTKGAKETTDTYNFFNKKFVSWEWSQDDKKHVMDPNADFFADSGKRVQAEAEEGLKIIQKAFIEGPVVMTAGKAAPPIPEEVPPPLKEYADFRKDINDRIEAKKLSITKVNLPGDKDRVHYISGYWTGKKLERAVEWNAIDDTNGTFTFYFFNQHGILMSIFRTREGVDVPGKNFKKDTDTFNYFNGKLVSWKRTEDDSERVINPDVKGFDKAGVATLDLAKVMTEKILKAGPK